MTDIHTLALKLAGKKAYDLGVAISARHAVSDVLINLPFIKATVFDRKEHRVELLFNGDRVEGSCSCAESDGFDFCRHCVATIIDYNKLLEEEEKLRLASDAERVSAYINQLPKETLKRELLDIILNSPSYLNHWATVADVNSGRATIPYLKKLITKALPLKDIWKDELVRKYFKDAHDSLNRLFIAIEALGPKARFELFSYALERYDKILGRIEDSSAYRLGLLSMLQTKHAQTFREITLSHTEKARFLMSLFDTEYVHFEITGIPNRYIGPNETQLKEQFYKHLESSVKKNIQSYRTAKVSNKVALKRKVHILVTHLVENNAFVAALDYLSQVSETQDECIDAAELAIKTANFTLAKKFLSLAESQIKTSSDKLKLQRLRLRFYEASEQYALAFDVSWDLFCQTLDVDDFNKLCEIQSKMDTGGLITLDNAEKLLKDELSVASKSKDESRVSKVIDTLIELYLRDKAFDKALALASQYELAPDTLHDIAYASLGHKPKASFNIYRQLCMLFPQQGTSGDYASCVELLHELNDSLPREPFFDTKFNHLLANLYHAFSEKEKFVKQLQNEFPSLRGESQRE